MTDRQVSPTSLLTLQALVVRLLSLVSPVGRACDTVVRGPYKRPFKKKTIHIRSPPREAAYWGGPGGPGGDSGGPGGGSGGPGGGSETVFGTDVRNRQCSEQCSEPTKQPTNQPTNQPTSTDLLRVMSV